MKTKWLPIAFPVAAFVVASGLAAQAPQPNSLVYVPSRGTWEHKAPADVGLDPAKLKEAVEWAESHGAKWDFAKDQVRVFGQPLGALPAKRDWYIRVAARTTFPNLGRPYNYNEVKKISIP